MPIAGERRLINHCLVSRRYARRVNGRTKNRIDLAAALSNTSFWGTILSGVLHIGKQDWYQGERRRFFLSTRVFGFGSRVFFLRLGYLALILQRHYTRNNMISTGLLTPPGHHPISSIPAGYVLEVA